MENENRVESGIWKRYKLHISDVVSGDVQVASDKVSYWRNIVFCNILTYVIPLSLLALIPCVYMAFRHGVPVVGFADLFAFLLIVIIAIVPGIKAEARKSIFIFILYCLAVTLLIYLPLPGPGLLFLLVVTIFSSLIYSSSAAYYSALINTLLCGSFALLIYLRADLPGTGGYNLGTWIAISSNLVFLSFACAKCLDLLLTGLVASLDRNKIAEEKLIKSNRLYSYISAINQMIVKTNDETLLYKEVCRIAVDIGKYRMAWIGRVDEATRTIVPLVHAGEEDGYLTRIKAISIDDIPEGGGPTGTALRQGKYIVCNDIQSDLQMAPWWEEAASMGYQSSMALPIMMFGNVVASYSLYSASKNFFDEVEIAMAEEAARDICFALENIEKEQRHKQAEEIIIRNEKRFRALIEQSGDMETLATMEGKLFYASPSITKVLGYTVDEFLNAPAVEMIHPDDLPGVFQNIQAIVQTEGGSFYSQHRIKHKNGNYIWCEGSITNMLHEPYVNAVVSNFREISARKKAEEQIEIVTKRLQLATDNAGMGIWDWDIVNNNLVWDEGMYRLYRINEKQLGSVYDGWLSRLHPDDKERVNEIMQQALANKGDYNPEFRIVWDNSTVRYIKASGIIERDKDGNAEHIVGVNWDITELKEKEHRLIVSSNELQRALNDLTKIMDSSLDVICAVDANGYFLKVSAASEAVWGYTPGELIGKPLIDFVYHEDKEKTQLTADKVMSGNRLNHFENRYVRKDGSVVPIEWTARWDENDQVRYGIARDVTEKKRLQKAFELERQQFYDLFSEAPSSMGVLSGPNHRFEMANPLYLQLIGKRDIIGKSVKDVLPEVEGQGFIEVLDSVYQTGKSFSANEMNIKLDVNNTGKPVDKYLNFLFQPHIGSDGKPDGILFFAVDVTEQVMSRKKLEESQKEVRAIAESMPQIVWVTTADGKNIYFNHQWVDYTGLTLEESLGDGWLVPFHEEDKPQASEAWNNAVKTISEYVVECRLRKYDGTYHWWLIRGVPKINENGEIEKWYGTFTDIEKIKEKEEEKEIITRDLIQRNKNLEQFSYIVSHNLRAPVVNILGFSELMSVTNYEPNLIQDAIKGMSTAAQKLDTVIRDMNEILQINTGVSESKEEVHFQDLVQNISVSIDNIIKRENVIIRTNFQSAESILSVKGYLYSIFYNLILNSIKFHKPDISPLIEISSQRTENGVRLIFKDNGMGFDLEKNKQNLFGLYKRFHTKIEGKGMGMYMIKTHVETLGGTISIVSEVDKGAEFTIEFRNDAL